MATRDEVIAAIRNADKSGDSDSVRKLGAYLRTMDAAPVSVPSTDPTGSAMENVAAGAGAKLTDLALGAKQRFDEAANYLESKLGGAGVSKALGMPTAAEALAGTKQAVIDKRKLDAPLMATTGGKVGAVIGVAAPALVAGLVPGGQGLAGSMLTGAAMGGVEPTAGDESALENAALGGAAGAAGFGLGKGVAAVADKVITGKAAAKTANAVKDAVGADARAAGYVIPPTQTNPTVANRALEGLAGKISTGQAASIKNQSTTNSMARKALGLADDAPLSIETLKAVRAQAGDAYNTLRNLGPITADAKYAGDLLNITSASKNAAANFPGLAKSEIDDAIAALNQKTFDAGGAVDAIRILRDKADAAWSPVAGGDKSAQRAFKAAADALEGVLERNLQATAPDAVPAFQAARQLIAKTYSVEKALNPATGNVVATKLGAQLARQKPLSGELETVARMGLSYPKAAQEIASSMPGVSPLDFGASLVAGGMGGHLASLATIGARPAARSLILSRPYQALAGSPSYGSIADLLAGPGAREVLRIGGLTSPQLAQQK